MCRQRVAIAQRLDEVTAGVDEEHGRRPVDRGDAVQQDGRFRAERGDHGDAAGEEFAQRRSQHFGRSRVAETALQIAGRDRRR